MSEWRVIPGHESETECGFCWAERNGVTAPDGLDQWQVIICDECDEIWPCAATREANNTPDAE